MGFSISWMGVRAGDPDAVLKALGLVETDAVDPDNRALYSCARLQDGKLIIYSKDFDYVTPARLAIASMQGEAIGCKVECDNGMTVACKEVCAANREYLRLHLPGQLHHEAITPRRDRNYALR